VGNCRNVRARHGQLLDSEQRVFRRRHLPAPPLHNVGDHQHMDGVAVDLEPVRNVLAQDRRREGANNARYFPLRLKSDCMVGERASPRIERAPGARGPNSMRPWHQPIARPAARSPALFSTITAWVNRGEAGSGGRQAGVNIVIGERRTQKGAAHHLRAGGDHARHVAHAVIGRQRGTNRAAGIAICMLHPHLREPSVAHHAAIGHAVESHIAAQA